MGVHTPAASGCSWKAQQCLPNLSASLSLTAEGAIGCHNCRHQYPVVAHRVWAAEEGGVEPGGVVVEAAAGSPAAVDTAVVGTAVVGRTAFAVAAA